MTKFRIYLTYNLPSIFDVDANDEEEAVDMISLELEELVDLDLVKYEIEELEDNKDNARAQTCPKWEEVNAVMLS